MENYIGQLREELQSGRLRLNWRAFLLSFVAMFLMVSLQLLGVRMPNIMSPLGKTVEEKVTKLDLLRPQLEMKKDDYSLKQNTGFIGTTYAAADYDAAHAYAVIDYDTGDVLLEKDLIRQLPIASLTKIMTAVVALDLASPDEAITITDSAASQIPTKIGVVSGERMLLSELIEALLLTSANDAAEAIKDGIDEKYGDKVFVAAMNEKASIMGLSDTHFDNPQGFDGDNYSTAADLALLTHYALTNYPMIVDIVRKDATFLSASAYHEEYTLYNWNGLIGVYPGVYGVKIGNTELAKKTTVVISEREGKKMLVILLGAPSVLDRDMWAASLLDAGYQKSLGLACVCVKEEQLHEKYRSWQNWN